MAPTKAHASSFWKQFYHRTQHGDVIFWAATLTFALVLIGMITLIGIVTFNDSALAREEYGLGFLFNDDWNPVETVTSPIAFGAWPAIYGTLITSLIAVILAAPIGIGVGVFLAELSPRWLSVPLSFLVELLAAIPSVVYGLWGAVIFAPFLRDYIGEPIAESLGKVLPQLAGPVGDRGLVFAGTVLAIMILPTIAAISRDVIAAVPSSQREVLQALGATSWEVIWLGVLPYALAGILGGIMLGLGRALGETMAAIMLVGNNINVSTSLFGSGTTAASLIANQLPNANNDLHRSALIYIALVLFSITLLLNLSARILVWYVSRKR